MKKVNINNQTDIKTNPQPDSRGKVVMAKKFTITRERIDRYGNTISREVKN